MNKLLRSYYILQALGWDNVPRRAWHVAKGKLGITRRRLPGGEISSDSLSAQFVERYRREDAPRCWQRRVARFFVSPQRAAQIRTALKEVADEPLWQQRVGQVVENLARGEMLLFSHLYAQAGWPINFNRDPIHGVDWPTGRHWTTYQQFDATKADLKCVWEMSRFSWAFYLARQHARHPESPAATMFWDALDAWDRQNPYGLTPQWVCGQEASFRLFAWLFAAAATLDHPAATPARLARLTELVWYTARHIERNINYARSQKNNHAVSEAVGLYTIGVLFPELRRAPHWRDKGRSVLAEELSRQIYDDGSFVQHSLNYHRVMLHDVLWAAALARSAGEALPPEVLDRAARASEWLIQTIDWQSGSAPNYGANDGALILPLSCCDYTDYRPVATAAAAFFLNKNVALEYPWHEETLWLTGGATASRARKEAGSEVYPRAEGRSASQRSEPARLRSQLASHGGYFRFRGPRTFGLLRCHSYRDRPGQADMLHYDLFMDGVNVLRDGGTYMYYCPPPWQQYFRSTAAHNTIEIDGQDQMIAGPHFLWLRWTQARLLAQLDTARVQFLRGEHAGYQRLPGRVVHRRSICRLDDCHIVIDDVLGDGEHNVALRWRLAPGEWRLIDGEWLPGACDAKAQLAVHAPARFSTELFTGQERPRPEGWESLYYAERTPTPILKCSGKAALPVRFITVIQPPEARVRISDPLAALRPESPVGISGLRFDDLEELVEIMAQGLPQSPLYIAAAGRETEMKA